MGNPLGAAQPLLAVLDLALHFLPVGDVVHHPRNAGCRSVLDVGLPASAHPSARPVSVDEGQLQLKRLAFFDATVQRGPDYRLCLGGVEVECRREVRLKSGRGGEQVIQFLRPGHVAGVNI